MFYYKPSTVLTCGKYKASIMSAPRLEGERVHSLPPGTPIEAFETDAFVDPDPAWMLGEGCWVVPVNPDKGLWFDWRANDATTTAVLPSVKGANPITGMPMQGLSMEQFKSGGVCPRHGVPFNDNKECPECGFVWPDQNYVVDPDGKSPLWLDGFKQPDGKVRQFFFTEDMRRDVASHLIGHENTVPAFGFAFYRRKTPFVHPYTGSYFFGYPTFSDSPHTYSQNLVYTCSSSQGAAPSFSSSTTDSRAVGASMDGFAREVAVGAGAQIDQSIPKDPSNLADWDDRPEAVMRIYFVFENELAARIQRGLRPVIRKEGMLAGLPVG